METRESIAAQRDSGERLAGVPLDAETVLQLDSSRDLHPMRTWPRMGLGFWSLPKTGMIFPSEKMMYA